MRIAHSLFLFLIASFIVLSACQSPSFKRTPNLTDIYALTLVDVRVSPDIDQDRQPRIFLKEDPQKTLNLRLEVNRRLEAELAATVTPHFTGNRPAVMNVTLEEIKVDTHRLRKFRGGADEIIARVEIVNPVEGNVIAKRTVAVVEDEDPYGGNLIGAVGNIAHVTVETISGDPVGTMVRSVVTQVNEWILEEKNQKKYVLQ